MELDPLRQARLKSLESAGRLMVTVAIFAGGLSIARTIESSEATNSIPSAATCETLADTPPTDISPDNSWQVDIGSIRETPFFTSEKQYDFSIDEPIIRKNSEIETKIRGTSKPGPPKFPINDKMIKELNKALLIEENGFETAAQQFLGSSGITVEVNASGSKSKLFKDAFSGNGPNLSTLTTIAFLPKAIVKASGLSKVVYTVETPNNLQALLPEYQGGTLTIGYPSELVDGISRMVLNSCPDKQSILDYLTALNGGSRYNYSSRYASFINAKHAPKDWQQKYGKIFYSPASMTDPEIEFTQLFSQAIMGWNDFSKNDLNTVLGQKEQFIQGIFDHFVPLGLYYERFYNVAGYYGTHDLHPDDLATELETLFHRLDEASSQQAKDSLMSVWNGDGDSNMLPVSVLQQLKTSGWNVSDTPYPYEPPSALQPASD